MLEIFAYTYTIDICSI